MTWKELKEMCKDCGDEDPVAVLRSDGTLDYACDAWIQTSTPAPGMDPSEDDGAIVIVPN